MRLTRVAPLPYPHDDFLPQGHPEFCRELPESSLVSPCAGRPPASPHLLFEEVSLSRAFPDECGRLGGEAEDHGSVAQYGTAGSKRRNGFAA
jgi:hypothetical protein